jgi:hypothetical protein
MPTMRSLSVASVTLIGRGASICPPLDPCCLPTLHPADISRHVIRNGGSRLPTVYPSKCPLEQSESSKPQYSVEIETGHIGHRYVQNQTSRLLTQSGEGNSLHEKQRILRSQAPMADRAIRRARTRRHQPQINRTLQVPPFLRDSFSNSAPVGEAGQVYFGIGRCGFGDTV